MKPLVLVGACLLGIAAAHAPVSTRTGKFVSGPPQRNQPRRKSRRWVS